MRAQSTVALVCALLGGASAAPQSRNAAVCIPQQDSNPRARAAAVAQRNAGFIYGPSLIGEAAPFPNGTLGNARSKADYALWSVDREEIDKRLGADVQQIGLAIQAVRCPQLPSYEKAPNLSRMAA